MIKAIIFDWGGVLIDDPTPALMNYCANAYGVDAETFTTAYKRYEYLHNTAKVPENDFWKYIAKELNVPNKGSDELWYKAFSFAYAPRAEVFALASTLKAQGYKIGFLSNTEIAAMRFFQEQNYDMFNSAVFSCQEGISKPDPDFYARILRELNVEPSEAILIDDRPLNTEGARQIGINTIVYEDYSQVVIALKANFNFQIV